MKVGRVEAAFASDLLVLLAPSYFGDGVRLMNFQPCCRSADICTNSHHNIGVSWGSPQESVPVHSGPARHHLRDHLERGKCSVNLGNKESCCWIGGGIPK